MRVHPSATVHPSAVIETGAEIGENAHVGPFCCIGGGVTLGRDVDVRSHAVITGNTEIGAGTQVFSFACLGEIPQDLKFAGEETRLVVGERCRIREHVTMNTGTAGGGGVTIVGNDCLFMACVHIAHDCIVGDRVIMANNSALAGHCVVGDGTIIGGLSGVHQWVRIGEGAIIGAVTMVTHDVIPYALVQGPRGALDGLNLVGLKRAGVSRDDIAALRAAFRTLGQGEGAFQERVRRLGERSDSDYVRKIVDFVLAESDRGFLTPP